MTEATTAPADPRALLQRFHERREHSVTSPQGFLALVNTQWVQARADEPGESVWGAPGLWTLRGDGQPGLQVTAQVSDGIRIDGELVDGTAIARAKTDPHPSEIVFSQTLTGTVIVNEAGGSALRLWDSASETVREFGRIDTFDFNPDWIVQASFTPNSGGTVVGFEHVQDAGAVRDIPIPGSIRFAKDGVEYDLAAFQSGRALQLVFSDATSGDTSYSVGRFLFVAPRPDGTVILDFNQAVLPPCAFSYSFNCPMPPQQNRFSVPIDAGEKNVLKADGSLLHG